MFILNGDVWRVRVVDPNADYLIDRTGEHKVATTDPNTHCVYLSSTLNGDFLVKVFLHELGHCVMVSYDLFGELHEMVKPRYWLRCEEWLCNFIADYGRMIYDITKDTLGERALEYVPVYMDKLIA